MAAIRNELRQNDQGKVEVWTNLGDILDWLDTLPSAARSPVAAGTAMEIKQMLLDQFDNAVPAQLA
jgi:hypothetical protein